MKMGVLFLVTMFCCSASFADGFVCEEKDGILKAKVYNHVQPKLGTRKGAVMVLSDPNKAEGQKTLAVFKGINKVLFNSGPTYISYVNPGVEESSQLSAEIADVRTEEIYSIVLDVDFDYNNPVAAGQKVLAELVLVKNNGDKVYLDLECRRYLKQQSQSKSYMLWWHL